MAVIYRDTTTKYNLSWSALTATANQPGLLQSISNALQPFFGAANKGIDFIGSAINSILPQRDNQPKDKQSYLFASDDNQEDYMLYIVLFIALVIGAGVIFMKRKGKTK